MDYIFWLIIGLVLMAIELVIPEWYWVLSGTVCLCGAYLSALVVQI